MTGPEHYREAESLLQKSVDFGEQFPPNKVPIGALGDVLAAAQVHATLALAAATAESIAQAYDSDYDTRIPAAWSGAIS